MAEVEVGGLFRQHARMAYGLALSVTGDPAAAEDAVQEAFVRLIRQGTDLRAAPARAYLARTVLNVARNWRRGEARRRAREGMDAAPAPLGEAAGRPAEAAETQQALRAALAALSEEKRVPVLLHVVDDFPQREVARILELPHSTVSHRIRKGLAEIRAALVRGGFAALALPALVRALAAGGAVEAPAGLVRSLASLAARSAAAAGRAAGAAPAAAAKGGIAMKLVAGVVLAGAVAAGAAVSTGMLGRGGRPLAAKAPGKFSTPVWHPDARWQVEKFASCSVAGHLDGPRLEMEYFSTGVLSRLYRINGAGRYVYSSYDPKTERAHKLAGSARGYLDGPFSRARMGGWDYVTRSTGAASPDGRYLYMTDGYNRHVLRCFDLAEQTVRTLLPDAKGIDGMAAGSEGKLYILKNGQFVIVRPDGTTRPGPKVELKEKIGQWGASLALDEKHGRIYGTCYSTQNYYIWYWDLEDGSFHGVLPTPGKGGKGRGRNRPGPFEGTNLYNQGSILFGPDDPERRFLYTGRVDTWNFFRLDLEKKRIAALDAEGGRGKPTIVHFSYEKAAGRVPFYGGGRWTEGGDFLSKVHSPRDTYIFRRIQ